MNARFSLHSRSSPNSQAPRKRGVLDGTVVSEVCETVPRPHETDTRLALGRRLKSELGTVTVRAVVCTVVCTV